MMMDLDLDLDMGLGLGLGLNLDLDLDVDLDLDLGLDLDLDLDLGLGLGLTTRVRVVVGFAPAGGNQGRAHFVKKRGVGRAGRLTEMNCICAEKVRDYILHNFSPRPLRNQKTHIGAAGLANLSHQPGRSGIPAFDARACIVGAKVGQLCAGLHATLWIHSRSSSLLIGSLSGPVGMGSAPADCS